MTDQPGPARFQVLFESALQAYEKREGVMLAYFGYPLLARIRTCHSVGDITTLLQGQAQAFDDLRQRGRIFESIRTTVSILTPSSSVADDTSLVSQKTLMDSHVSDQFYNYYSHIGRQYTLLSVSYWTYVPISSSYVDILPTSNPTRQLTA